MKNIREIISTNLITLRKQSGLTQVDLAKKLKYSDKAVSRWEKGEVIPDVETLQNIANVYDVPLTYLFKEHHGETFKSTKPTTDEIFAGLLAVSIVWTIFTVVFVYLILNYNYIFWQAFVWPVPLSTFTIMLFTKQRNRKQRMLFLVLNSILNWTLLTSIYLQFLTHNLWLIFLIGIPIQAVIVVYSYLKPVKRHKKDLELED